MDDDNVIRIIRKSGPNFLPLGTYNGRLVEHSWALGSPGGDWRYADDKGPRGYLYSGEIADVVDVFGGL